MSDGITPLVVGLKLIIITIINIIMQFVKHPQLVHSSQSYCP